MNRRRVGALSVLAIAGLVATACAGGGGGETEADPTTAAGGVPYGASKAEYQEAFADVDPIEIVFQTSASAGSQLAERDKTWVDTISEWSDGKMTLDLNFAGEIAPGAEAIPALQEGRLDLSTALPQYDPQEFPVFDEFMKTLVLTDTNYLVAPFQAQAWTTEVMLNTPEIVEELAQNDLVPLLFQPGFAGVICAEPLTTAEDFSGRVVAVGTSVGVRVLQELGASPTSLPFTEYYEGLQRGVVDCVMTGPEIGILAGLYEVAPYLITWPSEFMVHGAGLLVMNKTKWDALPLIAQQLLVESMDVATAESARVNLESMGRSAEMITQYGGDVLDIDPELVDRVTPVIREEVLGSVEEATELDGPALVERARESSERWSVQVRKFLGLDEDVDLMDIPEWIVPAPDYLGYGKLVRDEVFQPFRPE